MRHSTSFSVFGEMVPIIQVPSFFSLKMARLISFQNRCFYYL